MLPYDKKLKSFSRQLRSNMTEAEKKLWYRLRIKQLEGHQFYRQKPIGGFIVDLYCPRAKLVIELDGGQHYFGVVKQKDEVRDRHLRRLGLKILRFSDNDVLENIDGVLEEIYFTINPPQSPFVKGGNTG